MMNFTVEETNLIDIYHADTRIGVLDNLRDARPYCTDDLELLSILDSAARKLGIMTDRAFLEMTFRPTYPVLFDESEMEVF